MCACSTSFSSLFFFHRYGAPRDLHSFPTRRSSDLAWMASHVSMSFASGGPAALPRAAVPRSEEHTSELQSLRHLVCRLLLEKKKNHLAQENKPVLALRLARTDAAPWQGPCHALRDR